MLCYSVWVTIIGDFFVIINGDILFIVVAVIVIVNIILLSWCSGGFINTFVGIIVIVVIVITWSEISYSLILLYPLGFIYIWI